MPSLLHHPTRSVRSPVAATRELVALGARAAAAGWSRTLQRAARRGPHGAPVVTGPDRTVLLFFEDVEADRVVPGDRYLRRAARRAYHAVTTGQRVSGFEVAFHALCAALAGAGCRVVVNNAALARRHPRHPVGLCGYPHVIDRWTLPNPVVLGPGLFDHPAQAPRLMDDERFRAYLVPCAWYQAMFAPAYGDRCRQWWAGIDLDAWPAGATAPKDIDLLVYDKIRWDRETLVPALLDPICDTLRRRGLRYHVLRRGAYDVAEYRALLARARALVFVCEHETQGLAYQEAMACDVPVLAWDNGLWLDPARARYTDVPVPASSVPYFGPECGDRFPDAAAFPQALDRFWGRLAEFAPRAYVREHLSLERSARRYLEVYTEAAA